MGNMLNDLDLEEKIKKFSPAEQFLARELYELKLKCPMCKPPSKKQLVINVAGASGLIIAIIEGLVLWLKSGGFK